jgi:hypothetical protein
MHHQHQGGILPAAILVVSAFSVTGCVELEFDRMVGTAFPPAHMVNGQAVTLESIYNEAGIRLSVEEDETNIAQLPSVDSCINEAELSSLEYEHRHLSLFPSSACPFAFCNTYHLYGVVVNHGFELLGACVPGFVLGVMWETHTRSAFAIFYEDTDLATNPGEFLRTTAHEIGHAFNLHHSDGDGTSIMTQTSQLTDEPVYQFSDRSLDHLQNHPGTCKYPGAIGGVPFLGVTAEHAALPHEEGLTIFECE